MSRLPFYITQATYPGERPFAQGVSSTPKKKSLNRVLRLNNDKKGIGGDRIIGEYTAVIKKEDGWWVGWIEEVPGVNCQERTRKELTESLRVGLREALAFNKQDALSAAGADFEEEKIAL